jgi:L-lactate permease
MSNTFKILSQRAPAANTANVLYTVPANTQTIITSLNVCNQDNVTRTFSVAVVPSGEANVVANVISTNVASIQTKHYIAYQVSLNAASYSPLSLGFSLNANDNILIVSPNTANVSFGAFGIEITS